MAFSILRIIKVYLVLFIQHLLIFVKWASALSAVLGEISLWGIFLVS